MEDSCTIDRRDRSHKSLGISTFGRLSLLYSSTLGAGRTTVDVTHMHVKVSLFPSQHFCADYKLTCCLLVCVQNCGKVSRHKLFIHCHEDLHYI